MLARPAVEAPPEPEASRLDCLVITLKEKTVCLMIENNHYHDHITDHSDHHHHHHNHQYQDHSDHLSHGVPSRGHRLFEGFHLPSHGVCKKDIRWILSILILIGVGPKGQNPKL